MDNVVHAVSQPQKHGHNQSQKKVGRDMESGCEIVDVRFRISQYHTRENSQQWGFEDGREKIRAVAEFAQKSALEQGQELARLFLRSQAVASGSGLGNGRRRFARRGGMLDILKEAVRFVFVAPVVRRKPAGRHELAAIVFLQNDVAPEIAKGSF